MVLSSSRHNLIAAIDRRPRRAPRWSMTKGGKRRMAPILSHGQTTSGQCGFNQVASHPADPMKRHRARRERRHPKAMLNTQTSTVALDLLENSIDLNAKLR